VNKFRAKNLQPFTQLFNLKLNFFFDGGSFMKTVTDMDVHEHLKLADEGRKPVLYVPIVHPCARNKIQFSPD
jgi:hypothetical protein